MITAISVAAAFVVSLASPILFRPLLKRFGVIDVPNARSSHSRPILRGVGLAPLAGMIVGYVVLVASGDAADAELLVALIAVPVAASALGLVEDTRGLTVRVRAGMQLILGVGGAAAMIALTDAPWWVLPLFAFGIAGYINVANFMDGVDGISGMHGTVVGGAFSIVGVITGESWLVSAGLILSVAFVAFLPWNLLRGGMFLGDVGSYLLGGAVASIAVAAYAGGAPLVAVVGPVALYLADTGVTLVRRVMRRERWLESHRSHLYQRLCDFGLSHVQVAAVVAAATVLTSAFGLLSLGSSPMGSLAGAAGTLLVIAGYLSLPRFLRGRRGESERQERPETLPGSNLPGGAAISLQGLWAVVGSSGFIGTGLMRELRDRGIEVIGIAAPRLVLHHESGPNAVLKTLEAHSDEIGALGRRLSGVSVVVNAAGIAVPDSTVNDALFGANSLLPVVIARAAERAGVARYVHLSSAAVQGRRDILDESPSTNPFSPYSRAKALGEASLLEYLRQFDTGTTPEVVIVRATSVQGPGRSTTDQLRRIAKSNLASVARPGDRPTVVSSLRGLVEFVAAVGTRAQSVPTIVLQPWEGLTTSAVLEHAGGRAPIMLPVPLCRAAIASGYAIGVVLPPFKGIVRRVELMWMGQAQDAGWARSVAADRNSYVADVLSQRAVDSSVR